MNFFIDSIQSNAYLGVKPKRAPINTHALVGITNVVLAQNALFAPGIRAIGGIMSTINNLVRKWRVFEFDQSDSANAHASSGKRIVVIDRNDHLREDLTLVLEQEADRECRPLNIALLIGGGERCDVVTRFDQSGIAAAEIVRILNKTGFKGQLKFVVDEDTVPLHLTRRLKKLAIDFDLSTTTVSNLAIVPQHAPSPSITQILTSAMG